MGALLTQPPEEQHVARGRGGIVSYSPPLGRTKNNTGLPTPRGESLDGETPPIWAICSPYLQPRGVERCGGLREGHAV
ncbi:unnamed protein product [Gadus morhua 'NCC']